MAGASKFGGTENGADCSKCGGTVAVLFKTRNGTSLVSIYIFKADIFIAVIVVTSLKHSTFCHGSKIKLQQE